MLLRTYSFSFWLSERWKTAVTLAGMSLGIALFVGIQLANIAALSSFENSADLLRGGADFEVSGDAGEVPEGIILPLRANASIASVEPASRRAVEARGGSENLGPVEVLGLNVLGARPTGKPNTSEAGPSRDSVVSLLKDRGACWISAGLADRLGGRSLEVSILGKPVRLTPAAVLPKNPLSPGMQIVLDISAFQDLFRTWGYVDTLQIFLDRQTDRGRAEQGIRAALGEHLQLRTEHQNGRHAAVMTEAFRLNLQFLSCIALFVALLLVYNTMSFFVVKRRKDFATLQAIGVAPGRLCRMLFAEAAVLGLFASLLGLVLGYLMSQTGLHLINATLQNIYGQVPASSPQLSPLLVIGVMLLGPLLAFAGSFGPAREILSRPIREGFSADPIEDRFLKNRRRFGFCGLLLLAGSWFAAGPDLLRQDTRLGFLSPSLAVFSCCLLIPWGLHVFLRGFRRILRGRSLPALLATDHILSTPRRNSVAVASIAVSLAMGFALTVMIASFRDTVAGWITAVTRADIFISGHFGPVTSLASALDAHVLQTLKQLPEVRDYDPISSRTIDWNGRLVRVAGCRMEIIRDFDRLLFQQPMNFQERAAAIAKPETIFVSEVFARRTGKKTGDWVEIPGRIKSFRGKIENIFYDYTSDQGVIVVPLAVLEDINGVLPFQGVTLYLRDSSRSEEMAAKLQRQFAGYQLKVRNNLSLRKEVLRIFDDTFRITYALQGIAVLVSAAALMNTLSMLALERTKEFSVIRAIGASSRAVVTMVALESLILSVAGLIAGFALGIVLSLILVFVVNTHFFGWSIGFHLPFLSIAAAALMVILLAWLVGELHGRRILKHLGGTALRYE